MRVSINTFTRTHVPFPQESSAPSGTPPTTHAPTPTHTQTSRSYHKVDKDHLSAAAPSLTEVSPGITRSRVSCSHVSKASHGEGGTCFYETERKLLAVGEAGEVTDAHFIAHVEGILACLPTDVR